MDMPLIVALAAVYYYVFHHYRHCTIWVLLSAICLQISDAGSSDSMLRFVSPLLVMLHYYALSINNEQLEVAAIALALALAIITSPAFKNEVVLPDSHRKVTDTPSIVKVGGSPTMETSSGRRVEIITPSQPQPISAAITPGKSILKGIRTIQKSKTPENNASDEEDSHEDVPKRSTSTSSRRRKSAGGGEVNGMDADVLDALTSAVSPAGEEDDEPVRRKSTSSNNKRRSSRGSSAAGEDILAAARAEARAEMEKSAQRMVQNLSSATQANSSTNNTTAVNKRGSKRRAQNVEDEDNTKNQMAVDGEEEDASAAVPSPKKLRTMRKRASKMDL